MTSRRKRPLGGFVAREDGAATIEFVIYFPIIMFLIMTAFEVGQFNIRRVLLERAADVMINEVRKNPGQVFTHEYLKARFCDVGDSVLGDDCVEIVTIQTEPVRRSAGAWEFMSDDVTCADRGEDIEPPPLNTGGGGQLVQIRSCAIFKPIFPALLIGRYLPKDANGDYRVIAMSAYMNEPG